MCMWLCKFFLRSHFAIMRARACDYAYLCHEVSLWLFMHVHVIMHTHDMHPVRNYECMSMWICTFMMSRQLVTMHACACDYAHLMLCIQLVTIYARAWVMQFYATQSSCDYACLCMWLCTSMARSQLVTSHARACGYACMCMWLCTSTARSQTYNSARAWAMHI